MESTLFYGGKILTMEKEDASVEALAVIDGKIAGAGSYVEMENLLQKQKNVIRIDLKGNTLMPGFIDPHSHLVQLASSLRFVNLANCHTHTEIRQKLTAYKIKERLAPEMCIRDRSNRVSSTANTSMGTHRSVPASNSVPIVRHSV